MRVVKIPAMIAGAVLLALPSALESVRAQGAGAPDKDELINRLVCRSDQACYPPPVRSRRGVQPPSARRGFAFEPYTEEERKKLDDAAKTGKLPSADVEVYFDYNRADITPIARQALGPLGQALIDPRLLGSRFVLVGHTDGKGGDAYNQVLSERRAAAVKEYLVRTFGIAPERLVSYGRGKSLPKNSADPFAAENRRVQVINNGVTAGVDTRP